MSSRGRGRSTEPDVDRVVGWAAARAVLERRPDDVLRVHLHADRLPALRGVLAQLARDRRAYHVVDDAELEKVSASVHHEGICLAVRRKPPIDVDAVHARLRAGQTVRALFLGGVSNPNNVGALLRSAAHFGVEFVLADPETIENTLRSSAALRTAEGAAESVSLVALARPAAQLTTLREAGAALIATSSHAEASVYARPLPRQAIFLLGSERDGLPATLMSLATHRLEIPGTGAVESLNVGVAAAIFLAEHWRLHGR